MLCGLLVLAAAMAAVVTVAAGTSRGPGAAADEAYRLLEPGHVHGGTLADARADRQRARLCARATYRAAHPARCPSGRGTAVAGTGQLLNATSTPETTGRWAPPFQVPLWPIHEILLPTGKVLWLMKGETSAFDAPAYLWDPVARTTKRVDAPDITYPNGQTRPANLWCSGHALLSDGRVLVAGGNLAYRDPAGGPGSGYKGPRWVFTFDPWTEKWTRQPDMARGRWYPTVLALPDGRALIMGGWDENGNDVDNTDVEVFTPGAAGQGSVKVVAQRETALYPRLVVVPDNTAAGAPAGTQVLLAGPSPGDTAILNTADWSWRSVPDLPTSRSWSSGVLLPGPTGPRKLMLIGGYDERVDPATQRSTAVLDLDNVNAGWSAGPSMANGRSHLNVVLTPDEAVIAIGGGMGRGDYNGSLDSFYAGPVYATERLDPTTNTWEPADVQADERTYHSTALLLPDATVLSAGDDRSTHSAGKRTGEIYSPPYLFTGGTRPAITLAPKTVRYGAGFRVSTPTPSDIDRAVLVRPSSVTHSTDDQRLLRLAMTVQADGLTLASPPGPSLAVPGYYMLFLIDRQGRPSRASWIRLDANAPAPPPLPGTPPDTPPPAPPPDPSATTPGPGPGTGVTGTTPSSPTTSTPDSAGKPLEKPTKTRPGRVRATTSVPVTVRSVRPGRRKLRVVLRVSVGANRVTRVAIVTPAGEGEDPTTRMRLVRKGTARAVVVAFGFRTPPGWTVLSIPIAVGDGHGAPRRARLVVTMRKGAPVGVLKKVR